MVDPQQDKQYVNAEQMMEMAWQYFRNRGWRDVDNLCDKLIAYRHDHPHAWYLKGVNAQAQQHHAAALECLAHVRNAPDLTVPLHFVSGMSLAALGRVDEALAEFQRVLGFKPDHAEAHYHLALLLKSREDWAGMRSHLRQATLLDPDLAPAHFELGSLSLATGKIDEAVASLEKAMKSLSSVPEVANNLALAYQAAGNAELAEQNYRHAISLNPDYAEAHCNLGVLLHKLVRSEESAQHLERAFTLKPELRELVDSELKAS